MKKARATSVADELKTEYRRSELKNGIRGKHWASYRQGTNLVLLEPDIRAAFPTDAEVNKALRSLLRRPVANR